MSEQRPLISERSHQAARAELLRLVENARTPKRRLYREFAEQEFVLPDGKFEGYRYRVDRQPWNGLLLDEMDNPRWRFIVHMAPRQSGKTLIGYVLPMMYHAFEIAETFILMTPTHEMFGDKWHENLQPAIEASRYVELMPTSGAGSKGGDVDSIRFTNGVTMKVMTAGGRDKKRAGFTARVIIITEANGPEYDAGMTSKEGDKITQAVHCTDSFAERARVYMESTVTTEECRTWQLYLQGTASKIVVQCPNGDCREWVTPEREHLVGWREAESVIEAEQKAHFICPKCAKAWTEEQRTKMNAANKLVHRGQTIDKAGRIHGDLPATDTLGFRSSAWNNMFWSVAFIASMEWKAAREPDEENSEKAMCQFVWNIPYKEPEADLSKITVQGILKTATEIPRGTIPSQCPILCSGIDLGKWFHHWALFAFTKAADLYVVDYGSIAVPSNEMAEEQAVMYALFEFRDMCQAGWVDRASGDRWMPDLNLIDVAGGENIVAGAYAFLHDPTSAAANFMASKGYGIGHGRVSNMYRQPKKKSDDVRTIGEGYHISRLHEQRLDIVHVNDDFWKGWLHARVRTPAGQPGGFHLFRATHEKEHMAFANHLSAEKQEPDFDPNRGHFYRWVQIKGRPNHYFDAGKLACVAGHQLGVRVVRAEVAAAAADRTATDWFKQQKKNRRRS